MNIDSTLKCTVCNGSDIKEIVQIDRVPVFCNVQWPDYEKAIKAAVGDIHLGFCLNCGHVFNQAFEIERMNYTPEYENSLHFSSHFHQYAEELADRLIEKYALRNKTIVEIGCGKGEFISLLCEKGNNRGYGFDRSYQAERSNNLSSRLVTFSNDYYSPHHAHLNADFICCRHVLEHVPDPVSFLRDIRSAVGTGRQPIVYFEVPNLLYSVDDMGIWDFIYEHCSYFDANSLIECFLKAGFRILDIYSDFGNQFLCIESQPNGNFQRTKTTNTSENVAELANTITAFSAKYQEKIKTWRNWLAKRAKKGQHAAIWGAGSKGVTFLSIIKAKDVIGAVVDVNPNKHGLYIAGTGHQVVAPEMLCENPPDYIIVMNPIYEDEITARLCNIGVKSKIVCA